MTIPAGQERDMPVDLSQLPEDTRTVELFQRVPEELAADNEGFMGGWWCVRIAGDIVTLLAVRLDGDLSLLRRYEEVDFLSVVRSGEYLRFTGKLIAVGNSSRTIDITAERLTMGVGGFAADVVDPPQKVFSARAIIVVPKGHQRKTLPQAS
jgi:3-aminobutyryl-CoA ammonia-lyase